MVGARENTTEDTKVSAIMEVRNNLQDVRQLQIDTLVAAIEKCLNQAHQYLIELEEVNEPMKNNGYLMATKEK